jgi:transcriptional regulator with XRE-family HTH domain
VPEPLPDRPWRYALGARVKHLRTERGWSQEHLAEQAALHVTYVSGIERGRRNVSIDILARVARAFEIELRDLF